MTLPHPAGMGLLRRSPYRLRGEGESRLAVASYFVLPPDLRGLMATSARVLRGSGPVETTHPQVMHSNSRTSVRPVASQRSRAHSLTMPLAGSRDMRLQPVLMKPRLA